MIYFCSFFFSFSLSFFSFFLFDVQEVDLWGIVYSVVMDSHRDWNVWEKRRKIPCLGKPATAMRYRQSISRASNFSLKPNPFRTDHSSISLHSSLLLSFGVREEFHGWFFISINFWKIWNEREYSRNSI